MDKIKVGIPRSIPYYYYKNLWIYFFEKLNIDIIESPQTNKKIIKEKKFEDQLFFKVG
jgi:predicted nucleotide-binding protein (sugar kinase/HSP70/actin superfamily)